MALVRMFCWLTLIALIASACGDGDAKRENAPAKTVTVTTSTAEDAPQAPSTPPPATTKIVPRAEATRCVAGDLSIGQPTSEGAAGTIVLAFPITNESDAPCTTEGYPGISLLDEQGAPLTRLIPRARDTAATSPVTLLPEGRATFTVQYANVDRSPGSCPSAGGVRVIPPDDTKSVDVRFVGTGHASIPRCSIRIEVTVITSGD